MTQTIYFDIDPARKRLAYVSNLPLVPGPAEFRYVDAPEGKQPQVAEVIDIRKHGHVYSLVRAFGSGPTEIIWEVVVQPEGEDEQYTLEVRTPAITFEVVAEGLA